MLRYTLPTTNIAVIQSDSYACNDNKALTSGWSLPAGFLDAGTKQTAIYTIALAPFRVTCYCCLPTT